MSPPSSGYKNKRSKKPACCYLLRAALLFGVFFDYEGGVVSLQNVVKYSADYTALYPRRQNSTCINADEIYHTCIAYY
jgi:hypothetical protein